MPRRSNRLIYCYWDDREETGLEWSRRLSREAEHLRDLVRLHEAPMYQRRTIYTYGKRVRAIGMTRQNDRSNNLFMRTTSRYRPGPAAGEFTLLKHAMAVLITCWEPYVCGVRTKALDALIPDPGPFRAAWMLYVHPSVAGTVAAPDVPVVETAPDGGLFLAATRKPFKVEEPSHLEAARRIAAAVAHLNVERSQGDPDFPPWAGSYSFNLYEPRDRMWLGRILTTIIPDQSLYPDASNPHILGRIGPPDGAAECDIDDQGMAGLPWWASG